MTLWEAVCKQVVAAGAVGWLAKVACADPSPWSIRVMGVSLAVLAASIAAAAVRRMREPRAPDMKVPSLVMETVAEGFVVAGWRWR
jgi:hypothetical protein